MKSYLTTNNKLLKDEYYNLNGYKNAFYYDFLKALKEQHPLQSAHELKLCAYLK